MTTARNSALWSTDAPVALGYSRRRTRVSLWMEKRGLSTRPQVEEESAALGLVLQPSIAELHIKQTGDVLMSLAEQETYTEHYGVPMGSHYDYWNDTTKRLHEIKFFAPFRREEFGEPGSGDVPKDVLAQVLHEFACWNAIHARGDLEAKGVEVSVLFGNFERVLFVVEPDKAAIDVLVQRLSAFWDLVVSGTPPEPKTNEDIRGLHPRDDGSEVEATNAIAQACKQLAQVKVGLAQLKDVQESYEVKIKQFMGGAQRLTDRGELLATWKHDKGRAGYTVAPQGPARQFRLKEQG